MKKIYSGAKEVISWLGPKQYNIKRLFFSLEEHIEDHGRHCKPRECCFRSRDPDLVEFELFDTQLMDALRYLEDRPYWSRVWIIQEVVVANRVTLLCGNQTLSWPALVKFRRLVADNLRHISREAGKKMRTIQSLAA